MSELERFKFTCQNSFNCLLSVLMTISLKVRVCSQDQNFVLWIILNVLALWPYLEVIVECRVRYNPE